ncbi:MAG: hypothetical protein ACJAQ3_004272 [Planctomycetota bacterium]|jgi:hypothetical protein
MQASRAHQVTSAVFVAVLLAAGVWLQKPAHVAPVLAASAGNLVKNPGFEKGGKEVDFWVQNVPLAEATVKPRFTTSDVEPFEGKRSGSIRADYRGGLTAYTQVLRMPPRAKSIHMEARARLDRVTYEGGALLKLSFVGPDLPGGRVSTESRLIYGVADWTRLSIEASIPEGTKSMEVRCGVVGPCVASFDDVLVTASSDESLEAVFGSVSSDYTVRLPANATTPMAEPFVRIPLPLASEQQRPVAFRVNTRPEEKVASLGIFRQGKNRMLEVSLKEMFPGDEVKLRLDTLVMIDARDRAPEGLVRLPRPAQIKGEPLRYLEAAPGIDPKHVRIQDAVAEIKGNDLPGLLEGANAFVQSSLKPRALPAEGLEAEVAPDERVGTCLESGEAGPAGYANTLASVLRARGVPARLMVGTARDGAIDEHYFVDVWVPSLGWSRVDALSGEWPVPAANAAIHRLIDPLDARPDGSTPYDPKVGSVGLVLESRPDRMGRARLYRYAEAVTLMEAGWTELERRVDASYDDLVGDPLSLDVWLPIEGLSEPGNEIPGAAPVHIEVQRWLDSPRLVGQ